MRWLKLTRICAVCGTEIENRGKTSLCCSRKCYKIFKNNYETDYAVHCKHCGKILKYNQVLCGVKYCSSRCACDDPEYRNRCSENLKNQWKSDEFREIVVTRMKSNNPSYDRNNIEKALKTKELTGNAHNWKGTRGGNGTISEAESIMIPFCSGLGFEFNKAINTYSIRIAYPENHYAFNYKPDFVNFEYKLCIEIDGSSHKNVLGRERDIKKERCLNLLGYTVIRFSNEDVLNKLDFVKSSILSCLEALKNGTSCI